MTMMALFPLRHSIKPRHWSSDQNTRTLESKCNKAAQKHSFSCFDLSRYLERQRSIISPYWCQLWVMNELLYLLCEQILTSPAKSFVTITEALFTSGINIRPECSEQKWTALRTGNALMTHVRSDPMGTHVATFFRMFEHQCVLGHVWRTAYSADNLWSTTVS